MLHTYGCGSWAPRRRAVKWWVNWLREDLVFLSPRRLCHRPNVGIGGVRLLGADGKDELPWRWKECMPTKRRGKVKAPMDNAGVVQAQQTGDLVPVTVTRTPIAAPWFLNDAGDGWERHDHHRDSCDCFHHRDRNATMNFKHTTAPDTPCSRGRHTARTWPRITP